MGCTPYWQQVNEISSALRTLRRYGLEDTDAYRKLNSIRGGLIARVTPKLPRIVTLLVSAIGLSPHELKLWHDIEAGWMVEARTGPGAPPRYHKVSDQIAVDILKGRRLHEYAEFYARPPVGVDQ